MKGFGKRVLAFICVIIITMSSQALTSLLVQASDVKEETTYHTEGGKETTDNQEQQSLEIEQEEVDESELEEPEAKKRTGKEEDIEFYFPDRPDDEMVDYAVMPDEFNIRTLGMGVLSAKPPSGGRNPTGSKQFTPVGNNHSGYWNDGIPFEDMAGLSITREGIINGAIKYIPGNQAWNMRKSKVYANGNFYELVYCLNVDKKSPSGYASPNSSLIPTSYQREQLKKAFKVGYYEYSGVAYKGPAVNGSVKNNRESNIVAYIATALVVHQILEPDFMRNIEITNNRVKWCYNEIWAWMNNYNGNDLAIHLEKVGTKYVQNGYHKQQFKMTTTLDLASARISAGRTIPGALINTPSVTNGVFSSSSSYSIKKGEIFTVSIPILTPTGSVDVIAKGGTITYGFEGYNQPAWDQQNIVVLGDSYYDDTETAKNNMNWAKASPVSATIQAEKVLNYEPYTGGEFRFTLKSQTGNTIQTISTVSGGKVMFNPISYSAAGTYSYVISETVGSNSQVTYDTNIYNVYVSVKLNNNTGALFVDSITYHTPSGNISTTPPTFYNTKKVEGKIVAQKTLDGNKYSGNEFTFELMERLSPLTRQVGVEGNDLYQTIAIVKSVTSGVINFPTQTYRETGTYYYRIKETVGSDPNINYDTTYHDVKVVVSKDFSSEKLIATVVYGSGVPSTGPIFKNKSKTQAVLQAKKTVDNKEYNGSQYSFVLEDNNGKILETVREVKNGVITFSKLTYDTPGTYTYIIREIKGSVQGIQYDENRYKAKVVVNNNLLTGKLNATVTYTDMDGKLLKDPPTFNNLSKIKIKVKKKWKNHDDTELLPDSSLITSVTVELKANGASFSPKKTLILTKNSLWSGEFVNLDIYDQSGKEIRYSAQEVKIIYASDLSEEEKIPFEAEISDPTTNENGEQEITITNKPRGGIKVNKIGDNKEGLKGVEFTLQSAKVEGETWTPQTGYQVVKVTDAKGSLSFEDVPTGNYLLTETKTQDGLHLLAEPVKITLPFVKKKSAGEKGGIEGTDGLSYYYHVTYTIENNRVPDMPNSGGMGNFRLYGIGRMFLFGGGALCAIYVYRKGLKKKKLRCQQWYKDLYS